MAIQIVIIFQTGDVGLYSIKKYTLQQASVCIFQQHASTVNEVPLSSRTANFQGKRSDWTTLIDLQPSVQTDKIEQL